ncbi:MAG: D-glycero-beta-D-manno-heptose 1-phosphate adenylyltransferase [Phycisphaeraceae bacterium]|nr:MAG: D-glycero-beta-D-manno-heptose 1-phosphate adenylyltransferase [Phycisphaeraceae bacterium]
MDRLLDSLAGWKPFSALVVGDFMLDQLVYGNAERLSADAPVPVLHVVRCEDRPGGSANVCLDLAALKGNVEAAGVTGDDPHGAILRQALSAEGVGVGMLMSDRSRPTTTKQNLIGLAQTRHPQKMFRVDYESKASLDPAVTGRLLDAVRAAVSGVDVVCIEDYNKGVCGEAVCQGVIRAARKAGKPVFVDPARIADYSKYRGATAITPNRNEAEHATGLRTLDDESGGPGESAARVAHALVTALDLEAVVLTLDRHGALLLERDGSPVAVPTVAREVYDVTGAGDMFLAALAAGRANDLPWFESVRLANAAAGLEVEVFGVQPIPLERVHQFLLDQAGRLAGKVRPLAALMPEVEARRRLGQRVVFTNGCFDILHTGHVTLLERAKALGDYLVVGLNTDASVSRLKGPSRPVNAQDDRARVLSSLAAVDAVTFFDEDTPLRLIETIRPAVLAKGSDYTKDRVVGADLVESWGGRVELIDLVPGKSTSATIRRAGIAAG